MDILERAIPIGTVKAAFHGTLEMSGGEREKPVSQTITLPTDKKIMAVLVRRTIQNGDVNNQSYYDGTYVVPSNFAVAKIAKVEGNQITFQTGYGDSWKVKFEYYATTEAAEEI